MKQYCVKFANYSKFAFALKKKIKKGIKIIYTKILCLETTHVVIYV